MINRKMVLFFTLALLGWGCCASAQVKKPKLGDTSSEDMMANAVFAELDKKSVDVEDLLIESSLYFGKVVKLTYKGIRFYSSSSSSYLMVYGDDRSISLKLYLPQNRDALKWAVDECASDSDTRYKIYYDELPGSSGSLYVYVESNSFLAVGRRVRKDKGNMTYSW